MRLPVQSEAGSQSAYLGYHAAVFPAAPVTICHAAGTDSVCRGASMVCRDWERCDTWEWIRGLPTVISSQRRVRREYECGSCLPQGAAAGAELLTLGGGRSVLGFR